MKKRIVLLCTIAMASLCLLSGCGKGTKDGKKEVVEDKEMIAKIEKLSKDDDTLNGKKVCSDGDLGDYRIEIVEAEKFEAEDGRTGIRIYYDFTNESDKNAEAWMSLTREAFQDGEALENIYTYSEGVDCYEYENLMIRPGVTVRCVTEFACDIRGSEVRVEFGDWVRDQETDTDLRYFVFYNPAKLATTHTNTWKIEKVSDPKWVKDYQTEGEIADCAISISDSEQLKDEFGDPCVRISFDVTNHSSETITPWSVLYYYAYQDGIQLESDYYLDGVETDSNDMAEIAPDESLTVTVVYELRSDSPVEFEISDSDTSAYLGKVFKLD